MKLAVGAPGNWDSCVPEIGKRAGIFKKHGLDLDILYTQGSGETMQTVISNSVDVGVAAGTASVMGAFSKNAPVRIIAAGTTGTGEVYWYVKADSPIKSFKDMAGKTVGYSTNGASSHTTLLALIKEFGVAAKPVASGAGAATLVTVMTGQIDSGWAAPPFGLKELEEKQIRIIARGSDAPTTNNQTVRVHIANVETLRKRKDVIERFVRAYRESYDFLYDDPKGPKLFAEYAKVPEAMAIKIRDDFMPKRVLSPDTVSGLPAIMADAMAFKVLAAPLTDAQLAELIQIPPRK